VIRPVCEKMIILQFAGCVHNWCVGYNIPLVHSLVVIIVKWIQIHTCLYVFDNDSSFRQFVFAPLPLSLGYYSLHTLKCKLRYFSHFLKKYSKMGEKGFNLSLAYHLQRVWCSILQIIGFHRFNSILAFYLQKGRMIVFSRRPNNNKIC